MGRPSGEPPAPHSPSVPRPHTHILSGAAGEGNGGGKGFYQIFPEGRGLRPPEFLPHGWEQ